MFGGAEFSRCGCADPPQLPFPGQISRRPMAESSEGSKKWGAAEAWGKVWFGRLSPVSLQRCNNKAISQQAAASNRQQAPDPKNYAGESCLPGCGDYKAYHRVGQPMQPRGNATAPPTRGTWFACPRSTLMEVTPSSLTTEGYSGPPSGLPHAQTLFLEHLWLR